MIYVRVIVLNEYFNESIARSIVAQLELTKEKSKELKEYMMDIHNY